MPHGQFEEATRKALTALVPRESLEERRCGDPERIDRVVVLYLRRPFGSSLDN